MIDKYMGRHKLSLKYFGWFFLNFVVIPMSPLIHFILRFTNMSVRCSITRGKGSCIIHFFLAADFVTLPVASTFSVDLMTPTATVCFMSRTANVPMVGNRQRIPRTWVWMEPC